MGKSKSKIELPSSVKQLKWSKEKWAKKNGMKYKDGDMGKKDKKINKKIANKEYPKAMLNGLNRALQFISEHPNSDKADKVKNRIENVIVQSDLMEQIAKRYDKHRDDYPYIINLPNIILNTLVYYQNATGLSAEEEEIGRQLKEHEDDLQSFCEKVLKKPVKKYKENGLSDKAAFMLASLIPNAKLLEKRYWYKALIHRLYEIAETEVVDIDKFIYAIRHLNKNYKLDKKVIKRNLYEEFIFLKKSNRFKQFTSTQKELHETLQQNALKFLDESDDLKDILKRYAARRHKAFKNNNDGARIFKFVDHANSNSPYTNIKKVVEKLIKKNPDYETYFN